MAALSVHIVRLGTRQSRPSWAHISAKRSRNNELAATPPPSTTPLAPTCSAARRALCTNTSTTAVWNEAATSAVRTAGFLRTKLMTDVFRPLKLKSNPSLRMARGKSMAVGSPSRAMASTAGPPG
ncbi:unannotated protein [freshwater metagenome]|uniref:Unannotated protein n=1 Tax=freshwater metagenome TaxID=449393 RepID=A0A6J6GKG7_9ZZZZ